MRRLESGFGWWWSPPTTRLASFFGKLDNEPLLGTGLRMGDELAVGYDNVIEHRKASDFQKQ